MKKNSVRLPTYIKPERYQIMLKPDLEAFTYEGEETIYLTLGKPVKEITLHAIELEIEDVMVKWKDKIKASRISFNPDNETVIFTFERQIPKGNIELSLKFRGQLTDKLKGFYRSKYLHEGQEKYLATTQFEATDARRAFPCFDEPAQKAIFDVTLMIPGHLTAISNTIEEQIAEHESGYKVVKFLPSPKMSTYLLAFIVGDFEYIETKSKHGVLVRVFTTPGKKHQAQFALETAAKCLDFYDDYFDIPYPLPVLDLIALPDFASAAMENWGAVTYRETALLVDETQSSAAHKQWVAIVIAHELAHQWFGNLVTMHWWTDLWLNEGFASYMENFATDKLFPEWQIWDQYIADRFAVALRLDALANSHPIEIEVHHPNEISEIFDMVSYAKGSVVIRMLAEFLGADKFREGLRHYLRKHAYGNTITDDLWKSFETVSKKPISKMMKTWTRQAGYPLLSVNEQDGKFKLAQSRFFSSEISRKKNRIKAKWSIPVSALDADGSKKSLLLENNQFVIKRKNDGWVKFNQGETTLMRVAYNNEALNKLTLAIAEKQLSPADRLGIVRDAFALAEAGQFPTAQALELAQYFKDETELPVWEEIVAGFFSAGEFYKGEQWYPIFEKYNLELFAKLAKSLGWSRKKGESHATKMLRSLALMQMGASGHKPTLEKAGGLFQQATTGKEIDPDIRGVVYNLAAQYGGLKEFKQMVAMYEKSEHHHEEQDRIGRAMGSFRDQKVLAQVLQFALSKKVRSQDAPSIYISVARNFYGRDLAWNFLKTNWQTINERYNIGGHLLEWFVAPFSRFTTKAQAKEYEQFFKKHPAPNVSRTIQQVLERINSNEAWIRRDKKNIESWLKNNYESTRTQRK